MAIRSMTGFGEGKATLADLSLSVQISTVNKKQLDIHISLPKYISYLEAEAHKQIRKALSRGRVNATISIKESKKSLSKIYIDESLASSYLSVLRSFAKKENLKEEISIESIIKFNDVIKIAPNLPDNKELSVLLIRSLSKALNSLKKMRSIEGAELAKDISNRLTKLEIILKKIEKRAPIVISNYEKKLILKLKKYNFENVTIDNRIISEVALFGDRCDVSEEITRINSHIKQIKELIKSSKAIGRTLDFLCQELFREINTISSKSLDIKITNSTLSFKSELEKIREQVQNVE